MRRADRGRQDGQTDEQEIIPSELSTMTSTYENISILRYNSLLYVHPWGPCADPRSSCSVGFCSLDSTVSVKRQCERDDCLFIFVSPTCTPHQLS